MKRATGTIFLSEKTNRVLLNLRSSSGTFSGDWGFFGGKIRYHEKPLEALSRELKEEIGFIPEYKKVYPIDIFKTLPQTFMYFSFLIIVEDEFIPQINHESDGWGWFNINTLPAPLHPGAYAVLVKQDFKTMLSGFKQLEALTDKNPINTN